MARDGEEPKDTKYEKVFVGKIPIMLRYVVCRKVACSKNTVKVLKSRLFIAAFLT